MTIQSPHGKIWNWSNSRFKNAKLTDEQAREIRTRVDAGESAKLLAKEFGVTDYVIYKIKHGLRHMAPKKAAPHE